MFKDFQDQHLQGRSFRGQDLTKANFSYADIRGADFSQAILVGANFSYVKSGLKTIWVLVLGTILLFLATLGGFISGYAGAFVGDMLVWDELSWIALLWVTSFALILFLGFVLITIFRGIGTALWLFGVTVLTCITLFLAFPGTDYARANAILLALFIGINISGVLLAAIAIAVMRISSPRRMLLLIELATLTAAVLGTIAGCEGLIGTPIFVRILFIAIPATVTLISLSLYMGWRAVSGDGKYALIWSIAVILCSYGGTRFIQANLTDADFSDATLKNTDFRKAILTRTCWFRVKQLDHCRVEGSYLEDPKIRKLAITKNGEGQNFDHLDLRGLNLQGANLVNSSLIGTKLSEATLHSADLREAILKECQLYGADLSNTCLTGAIIENWSISTDTILEEVQCEYIYMRLPTNSDRDPCRKPDNRSENFKDGDFADFIAPIVRTQKLYQTQNVDLREVAENYKTLDIFHHQGVDPSAAAIAFQKLIEKYPKSGLKVLSIEGRGNEKIHFQAQVTDDANRSILSQEYSAIYNQIKSGTYTDLQAFLAAVAEKDQQILRFQELLENAIQQPKFYVETYQETRGNITISSVQGNISGVVGGDLTGTVDVSQGDTEISGDRNIEINKGDYRETSVNDQGSYIEGNVQNSSKSEES